MNSYIQPEPRSHSAFPIAKAGYPFIAAAGFTTAVFALLQLTVLALLGLLTTFFIVYFFRDPDRLIPRESGVVSPADGKVIKVTDVDETPYYEGACKKVSIFMSIFNVHVNRIPHGGEITRIAYHPGKFFAANLDKASSDNEHNAVIVKTPDGKMISTVQVAGLVARRIICTVQKGDTVIRGQRFGMICFGSRLDVYLPPDFVSEITTGSTVKAGTTILGRLE